MVNGQNSEGMCQGGKPGTGKLYTDVCLCCSTHTSGYVVDGLGGYGSILLLVHIHYISPSKPPYMYCFACEQAHIMYSAVIVRYFGIHEAQYACSLHAMRWRGLLHGSCDLGMHDMYRVWDCCM